MITYYYNWFDRNLCRCLIALDIFLAVFVGYAYLKIFGV